MPALSEEIIEVLHSKLVAYLQQSARSTKTRYIASGGSAAVFEVETEIGPRAIKVFDPRFFDGEAGHVERQRLGVQARLIGHQCPFLIQTFQVEEAFETAFIEMEFLEWPSLKDVLEQVPDVSVPSLILQLVSAAQFLESVGIVHRDIKPENIHVSADFSKLKLLDLGVARDIEAADSADATATDNNNKRPFLATAQYSSPEYLFRLDEPNVRLWKGLTFYQIGAVLHDLIMKTPIFHQEISLGNKWLVAKAVLVKNPSFVDGNSSRLAPLKALASRCLVKDLTTRLRLVNWSDFSFDLSPHARLKNRLNKKVESGEAIELAEEQRVTFERNQHWEKLVDRVRNTLISICTNRIPLKTFSVSDKDYGRKFSFAVGAGRCISVVMEARWGEGYFAKNAEVLIKASLHSEMSEDGLEDKESTIVCVSEIGAAYDEPSENIVDKIASAIEFGLDNSEIGEELETEIYIDISKAN